MEEIKSTPKRVKTLFDRTKYRSEETVSLRQYLMEIKYLFVLIYIIVKILIKIYQLFFSFLILRIFFSLVLGGPLSPSRSCTTVQNINTRQINIFNIERRGVCRHVTRGGLTPKARQ